MEINIDTNCGVYELRHVSSNTAYVGSSRNLQGRKYRHLWELSRNRHKNYRVQAAYNASTGNSEFTFTVLEYCDVDRLKMAEQTLLDSGDFAFNISPSAEGGAGPVPEETRAKISTANKGKVYSDEVRAIMAASKRGVGNSKFRGWFVTPIGRYATTYEAEAAFDGMLSYPTIWRICHSPDRAITKNSYANNRYLQSLGPAVINRTYADLGFGFEPAIE